MRPPIPNSQAQQALPINPRRGRRFGISELLAAVGSQPPKGYIQWHTWAEVQHNAGLRQSRCAHCGKWKYPQEMSALEETHKGTTRKHGGTVIITKHKVCNECAANGGAKASGA